MQENTEQAATMPQPSSPPTIQDVANALGMHKSTVSFALSGKGTIAARTRNHIRDVARQMGYEPNPLAQRLASGEGNQSVCIVSGILDMGLATEKILLIQRELTGRGLDVPIHACSEAIGSDHRTQASQVRQICRQRPRAVICGAQMINPEIFDELATYQANGGTVVSYDTPVPLPCDQVVFDREHNAYQVAKHLLERGHRKIGIAMSKNVGWLAQKGHVSQTERMQGFALALNEFGVEVRSEYVFQHGAYETGGAELAQQFLALNDRPTAMCVVNDYVALAFMVEVMRKGFRVPEDLSIIGHDNQPIASYCPVPLTSASQPVEEIAQSVVGMLTKRLDGSTETPRTVVVRGDLIERSSVAPLG